MQKLRETLSQNCFGKKKPPGVETLFKVKSWFRNYLEDDQKLYIEKVVFLRKRTDLLPQNCRLKIPFEILDTFLVTFFKIAGKTVRLDRCCDKILQIQGANTSFLFRSRE